MASESTKFNEQAARQWVAEVQDLNNRTDVILKEVANCLQEIQQESSGDSISRVIAQIGSELLPRFADLMSSMNKLVDALNDVIEKMKSLVDDLVSGFVDAAKTMVGGLNIG